MMRSADNKLGLIALTCLIVGSMIGGGAFALPQTISASAQAGAILVAWFITTLGMVGLTFIFRYLNEKRPDLDGGIYSYASEGFGHFVGFISAWGYWLSAWVGNVSYAVLMFGALGFFFPLFGEGNTIWAVVVASLLLWSIHFLILRGVKEAATVNVITTIAKIIPIVLFLGLCIPAFHLHNITQDFWGVNLGGILPQIKSTMLVTLWGFIGIEGAVVVSARAKKRSDVGKATLLGLLMTLFLYVLISFLSLGVVGQPTLSGMPNPSMAYVLEAVVGKWGAILVNVGLVISLAGAWLGWTLLSAELPEIASKDHVFPKILSKENKRNSPAGALWLTNILIQIFLLIVFFSHGTYLTLLKLATSCVLLPYLFSGLFSLKLLFLKKHRVSIQNVITKDGLLAIIGTAYALFLIYSAGIHYLLLGSILYLLGVPFYLYARVEARKKLFSRPELLILVIIILSALIGAASLL
jgi:arginine:ornithine antiporter / lysine permease